MSSLIKGRISDPTGSFDPYLFFILAEHSASTYEYNTTAIKRIPWENNSKKKKSSARAVTASSLDILKSACVIDVSQTSAEQSTTV